MAHARTILLVEDNPADVPLVRMALEDFEPPCALEVRDNGADALDWLTEAAGNNTLPDFVILDLSLPRLDGRALLERIRGTDSLAHLPVAILTGSHNPRDEADLMALGADLFLIKPPDGPPELGGIFELIGRARLQH